MLEFFRRNSLAQKRPILVMFAAAGIFFPIALINMFISFLPDFVRFSIWSKTRDFISEVKPGPLWNKTSLKRNFCFCWNINIFCGLQKWSSYWASFGRKLMANTINTTTPNHSSIIIIDCKYGFIDLSIFSSSTSSSVGWILSSILSRLSCFVVSVFD